MKKSILVTGGAGFPGSHLTFPLYVEVDQIYNLACPVSPIYSLVIPD
ncbi:MAG: hypothetical protein MI685_11010 [Chlorobiales bacterium]|nr:hypothetical protein [Chlorobiales bacterium]